MGIMDVGVEQQQLFEAETKTVVKLSPLVVHCKKEPYDVYMRPPGKPRISIRG